MSRKQGFTLIELLVVIAIIGILASVVLASLNSARVKSRDAARMAQVDQVKKALELYNLANGGYPAQSGGPWTGGTMEAALVPDYISAIPDDPVTTGSSCSGYSAAAGNSNFCYVSSNPGNYGILINFEDESTPGTNNQGKCKTGVNVSPGWWGNPSSNANNPPICNF